MIQQRSPRKVPVKKIRNSYHYTRKNGKWKPKLKFDSKEEGESYIQKHKFKNMTCYRCPDCGYWHVGHEPKSI